MWLPARRLLLVPEVIQTSGMDCGPASLQALLAGHGIATHYGRLREACHTDVDGTSIDRLEEVAVELGLDAEQYIVPLDHLLRAETEALPALIVVQLPNGLTHFVVVWSTRLGVVQLMDPSSGRVFRSRRQFLREVLEHQLPVPRALAREWLGAPAFIAPLRSRLAELGLSETDVAKLVDAAQAESDWLPLAALDAATRLSTRLVGAGALAAGTEVGKFVERLAAQAVGGGVAKAHEVIPITDWSVRARGEDDEVVALCGAVIVHVEGRRDDTQAAADEAAADADEDTGDDADEDAGDDEDAPDDEDSTDDRPPRPASPELAAALGDRARPLRSLVATTFAQHPAILLALPFALLLIGGATALEAALFGGLTQMGTGASTSDVSSVQSMVWLVASFLVVAMVLEASSTALLLRLGRSIDVDMRMRLLAKLPRLGNHYFHSRLTADLAHRAHELRSLRSMPGFVGDGLQVFGEILATVVGIAILVPNSAALVIPGGLLLLALPMLMMPILRERDLRRETHAAVLVRFHLDALLGLLPIRAHRAERTVRAEHEALLVKWAGTTRELNAAYLLLLALVLIGATVFGILIVIRSLQGDAFPELSLLVAYWALKLPMLSQAPIDVLRQLPRQHNRIARLDEVLTGPEETELLGGREDNPASVEPGERHELGVHVEMRGLDVHAGGQQILADIELELRPGEHVAIVGASGSGKTSLVGLLLGWHRSSRGSLWIDGRRARAEVIHELRRETAWVDPAVALWNRSLAANLRYGNGPVSDAELGKALATADLLDVVARLEHGLDTSIGESGGLLSGGEGQRVRFARALLRPGVRLCVLDEPFRGLEKERREALLAAARERWRDATLLYVSHDIDAALDFDRVLVVEGGRIIEDGAPQQLLAQPSSRLAALHAARTAAQLEVWGDPSFRRWWMADGELRERDGSARS